MPKLAMDHKAFASAAAADLGRESRRRTPLQARRARVVAEAEMPPAEVASSEAVMITDTAGT